MYYAILNKNTGGIALHKQRYNIKILYYFPNFYEVMIKNGEIEAYYITACHKKTIQFQEFI